MDWRQAGPTKRANGKKQGSNPGKRIKKLQKPRAKPHVVYGVRQHGAKGDDT